MGKNISLIHRITAENIKKLVDINFLLLYHVAKLAKPYFRREEEDMKRNTVAINSMMMCMCGGPPGMDGAS